MSVGAVVPNRNYGHFLGRALDSLLAQTVPLDRIIVVDGYSSDGSYKVVESYHGAVSWLSLPPAGMANARNRGIECLDTEFILPLDADDWVEPTLVERCLEKMTPDVGVAAPELIWPDGHTQKPKPPFTVEHFKMGNLLFTCSMFRREAWRQVGGYDEYPFTYEDWDFWARIVKAGWQIVAVPEPLFHYHPHAGSSSARMNRNDHQAYWERVVSSL